MVRLAAYGWVGALYGRSGAALHLPGTPLRHRSPGRFGTRALVAVVAGVAALAVTLGWHSRAALAVFVPGFSWVEFIDVTNYLNHYWFVTILGAVLLLAPVDCVLRPAPESAARHDRLGVDAAGAGRLGLRASPRLAKLNADWLLHAMPLRLWLPARSSCRWWARCSNVPATACVLSWAGPLYDASIVALLCWRRTRLFAWCLVVGFHVATWVLFPIGVFPWLMIGASTIFFAPDVAPGPGPLGRAGPAEQAGLTAGRAGSRPGLQCPRAWRHGHEPPDDGGSSWAPTGTALLLLLPLRGRAIPGDSRWSGEGYRFSWNVLRVEKSGDVRFRVLDLSTGVTTFELATSLYTPRQWAAMATEPELIRQAAHTIGYERSDRDEQVAVYVDAFVSLNGRRAARLIDPAIDLRREPYRPFGQPWILPAPDGSPP